ncbi:MAG: ComF family protein [Clostridia bacterium]|nr:ComF family protein [Clostridia bacterium]
MTLRDLWQKGLFYVTVPTCVCCGDALREDDRALCSDCRRSYENMKARDCARCFRPIHRCTCSCDVLDCHFVHRLIKVTRYIKRDADIPSNALVYSLKKDNRLDVECFIADEIFQSLSALDEHPQDAVFTHVPRRSSAVRHFGYDHARRLSLALARLSGAEHTTFFRSKAKHAQKEMHGTDRLQNAQIALRHRYRHTDLRGKRVYLVDDIVTTGASMSCAAMALHAMGAKEIIGVCFSIAYLDS